MSVAFAVELGEQQLEPVLDQLLWPLASFDNRVGKSGVQLGADPDAKRLAGGASRSAAPSRRSRRTGGIASLTDSRPVGRDASGIACGQASYVDVLSACFSAC